MIWEENISVWKLLEFNSKAFFFTFTSIYYILKEYGHLKILMNEKGYLTLMSIILLNSFIKSLCFGKL